MSVATWTAIAFGWISRHLLQSFLQQRAIGQCFGSHIYLLLLFLGVLPLAFADFTIALNIVALGRNIFRFRRTVEFED